VPPDSDEGGFETVGGVKLTAYSTDLIVLYRVKQNVYVVKMKLKVVLERAEEGGYVVHVPSLPGCVSQGETREEALRNIKEAIELYLEPAEELALKKGVEIAEVAV